MNPKTEEAFNAHLNAELFSSYLYMSMAAYFEQLGLKGFAHWMRVQVQEELIHVARFFDFVHNRQGKVSFGPIAAPPSRWDTPLHVFRESYKHECSVTARINELVNLAIVEKDHAAAAFLQWFVNEQVEEEAAAAEIAQRLELVGNDGRGLIMIDQGGLAKRTPRPGTAPGNPTPA